MLGMKTIVPVTQVRVESRIMKLVQLTIWPWIRLLVLLTAGATASSAAPGDIESFEMRTHLTRVPFNHSKCVDGLQAPSAPEYFTHAIFSGRCNELVAGSHDVVRWQGFICAMSNLYHPCPHLHVLQELDEESERGERRRVRQ